MSQPRLFDRLAAPAERLLAALSDRARRERTAVLVLIAYVAVWTLYGVLAKASQDMHPDMTEMVAWSRELALGYPKHPPFGAWLTAAWFAVFPVADWSFYLFAMTVAGVALWIAWKIAGDYLDGERRALALALMTFIPFFNFHALKFNANTILLPLWAATAFCFLRSYERRSVLWAALAGLFAAGSMLGKYWSVFLLLGLGLAALIDRRRGAYFKSAAPWVTIVVGAVVMAPHVIWLMTADFTPLTYATQIRSGAGGHPLKSAGSYLIGSDGGRSTVRKGLGVEFEGYTHPERFMILTTTEDLGRIYPGCTRNYVTDPDAWFSVFKVSGDERGPLWRVLSATKIEQTDEELMNPDATEKRLQAFMPKDTPYDVVHRNLYNVHQRVAASFRKGRVFLAGDSAHVNNPLGGLGLNFGIHDSVELTTLLGQVIRGEAREDVLDQYDLHRRPLNIEFVQQQTIANKKRMEEKDPSARQKDHDQLRRTAEDPAQHRAYVRKASLIASVKKREAVAA